MAHWLRRLASIQGVACRTVRAAARAVGTLHNLPDCRKVKPPTAGYRVACQIADKVVVVTAIGRRGEGLVYPAAGTRPEVDAQSGRIFESPGSESGEIQRIFGWGAPVLGDLGGEGEACGVVLMAGIGEARYAARAAGRGEAASRLSACHTCGER